MITTEDSQGGMAEVDENGDVFRQQMANLGQLVGNLISSLTHVVGE